MSKKIKEKDLRELIAKCIMLTFPHDVKQGYLPTSNQIMESIIFDSIYIVVPNSGKYSILKRWCLNRYFHRYAGKNLICSEYDRKKNELIILCEFQIE